MVIRGVRTVLVSMMLLVPAAASAYGPNVCDFDHDDKADRTIVRDSGGNLTWWVLLSAGGTLTFPWGVTNDRPLCGDFDGDGVDDATVWRPGAQATFWVRLSEGGVLQVPFGTTDDDPTVINDYDGDSVDDLAVYRQGAQGYYWVRTSSNGALTAAQWGITGDSAHAGDLDGDSLADLHVQRNTQHWIRNSSSGSVAVFGFGLSTDFISALDYTGDGRADITATRNGASNLQWYVRNSATSAVSPYGAAWGPTINRTRVPADYDGDGKADLAVYLTTNGHWWTLSSLNGNVSVVPWGGVAGDIALNGFEIK